MRHQFANFHWDASQRSYVWKVAKVDQNLMRRMVSSFHQQVAPYLIDAAINSGWQVLGGSDTSVLFHKPASNFAATLSVTTSMHQVVQS